ncbi:MAG: hypothetical protein QXU87_11080, partial [Candidatus Caldarchaeum sp.]
GAGQAAGGAFEITLPASKTSQLAPGFIELTAVVYSEDVAQTFSVTERIEVRRAAVTETRTPTVQTTVTQTPAVEQPQLPLGLLIAVAGVIAVAAAIFILRRR